MTSRGDRPPTRQRTLGDPRYPLHTNAGAGPELTTRPGCRQTREPVRRLSDGLIDQPGALVFRGRRSRRLLDSSKRRPPLGTKSSGLIHRHETTAMPLKGSRRTCPELADRRTREHFRGVPRGQPALRASLRRDLSTRTSAHDSRRDRLPLACNAMRCSAFGAGVRVGGSRAAEAARWARPQWPGGSASEPKPVSGRDHRRWPLVNGVDDLGVVDPAEVHRRDPEIGMPELALYDQQRDTLAGHLDGVSMSQLVRRNSTANAGRMSRRVELDTDPGGRTRPTESRGSEHAEQRPDRQRGTELQPRVQLLPCPPIHPDLTTLVALCCARNYVALTRGSATGRRED
jgi:hypothetical protein